MTSSLLTTHISILKKARDEGPNAKVRLDDFGVNHLDASACIDDLELWGYMEVDDGSTAVGTNVKPPVLGPQTHTLEITITPKGHETLNSLDG